MLGISWFWFYGATFLAQFAGFSRDSLGGNEQVVTFLLALFSVGIGIGSLLCERMSGRRVELGLVPFGSIGLTVFAVDLWLASRHLQANALAGLDVFLASPAHWRVAADLCAVEHLERAACMSWVGMSILCPVDDLVDGGSGQACETFFLYAQRHRKHLFDALFGFA